MVTQRVPEDVANDAYILRTPISDTYRQTFLFEYLHDRRRTRTLEALFERVDAFRPRPLPAPAEARDFGFRAIVFKGSFVEGSHWGALSAQGYAAAHEDFLLRHLEETLRATVSGRFQSDVERDFQAVRDALNDMTDELQARGHDPTLFVITGQLGQQLYDDVRKSLLRAGDIRVSPPLRSKHRIVGVHAETGVPVLDIAESPAPALYAIDLARFATLTRYGTGPDLEPEFRIEEFTEARAREILQKQPRLILDPPPESGDEEERIRQLRLRVGLELWETYELKVKDPRGVIARPLVGPPVDY
jgi:hypothetical protein